MRLCPSLDGERGQSEVIGVALLIGVIVTVVFGVGAIVIADWQSEAEREAQVNVQSDLTATHLTLEHAGGDSLQPDNVLVVLVGEDTDLTLNEFTTANGYDRFKPGSSWKHEFASILNGVITVRVFDTGTNALLHEETYDVGQEGLVLTVAGQTGTTTIGNGTTVPYTVNRVFKRGSQENVSTSATVTEVGGNNLTINKSTLTVTGVSNGTSTVEATFNGTTASIDVTVVNQPNLEVTTLNNPNTAERGDIVTINGSIENTGTAKATSTTIELTVVDDSGKTVFDDTDTVSLRAGDSDKVIFRNWSTGSNDIGSHTVTLSSADDTNDTSLTVVEPNPSELINITEGETPLGEADSFDQHLTWENVHNQTVTLVTEGDGTDTTRTEIELAPGETVTPETLGFPESGVLTLVTDNLNGNKVTVEIDER